mmetsp:Transcript_20226/g.47205  ORF Transcript_20226/g.47205 Transcript_20226/m.47205 type:complete len:108 (+) Transcript_20226:1376-1699(+)
MAPPLGLAGSARHAPPAGRGIGLGCADWQYCKMVFGDAELSHPATLTANPSRAPGLDGAGAGAGEAATPKPAAGECCKGAFGVLGLGADAATKPGVKEFDAEGGGEM